MKKITNLEQLVETLNDLPENMPLYKDSGLWSVRSDDMQDTICQQGCNESFTDFIERYGQQVIQENGHSPLDEGYTDLPKPLTNPSK